MPKLYPHKQTTLIFIVCVLGVLGTILYVGGRGQGNLFSRKALDDMSNQRNIQLSQSNDLIATSSEWQKQFFGHSTSSSPQILNKTAQKQTPTEPETVTGQFGKKVFEQYMLLKQNNLADDQTAVKAAIDQNMNDVVATAPQAQVYDLRSVLVSQANDLAAEKTYANAAGQVLYSYAPQGDAAIIATEALDKNDPSRIKEIDALVISYTKMLKNLQQVPAPKAISLEHLNLINSVSSMVFVSQGMSKVFSDPLQSMVSLAVYEKSLASFQNALLDLKYNFSQKGIQFSDTDPGNIFTLIN